MSWNSNYRGSADRLRLWRDGTDRGGFSDDLLERLYRGIQQTPVREGTNPQTSLFDAYDPWANRGGALDSDGIGPAPGGGGGVTVPRPRGGGGGVTPPQPLPGLNLPDLPSIDFGGFQLPPPYLPGGQQAPQPANPNPSAPPLTGPGGLPFQPIPIEAWPHRSRSSSSSSSSASDSGSGSGSSSGSVSHPKPLTPPGGVFPIQPGAPITDM